MSETRKAGSEEFKQELAEASRDPNYEARLRLSNNPEKAAARAGLVDREKYDVSGYSDKEISMALRGGSFLDEDYARLTGKSAGGGGEDKPAEPKPPEDGGDKPVDVDPPKQEDPIAGPDPIVGDSPKDFLGQYIANSFNARGGTLTNSGNITSSRDVKLDNSVTNSNTFNKLGADGYRLNLGDLVL